ncbi:MAG: pyridoxal kinase [Alphaproteobacteria bacterium]|jgi:pyridoxine kinase|nr:pyridoxal kinase [Alphaproteobacteria bacterium]MDP6566929.1 pyridoxal kinase [Alphaproteobacteria bacterium]MDP6815870.1 pyridoxal kinase [Alphaproteobacteria bacterium]
MAKILSLTSHVVYGHVGAQAGILPLQRLGHEVWHLPTVLFSNHPGYGGYAGGPVAAERLAELLEGVAARGFLDDCAALHAGYLGAAAAVDTALAALTALRQANPGALFFCDPVLGDEGRLYVPEDLAAALRDSLVAQADIVTPNRFELEYLDGGPIGSLAEAAAAANRLRQRGPRVVVCTGAALRDGELGSLVVDDAGAAVVWTPHQQPAPKGTGDAFAAILLGRYLRGQDIREAQALASASLHGLIAASNTAGSGELALIDGQDEIVEPSTEFVVEPLA